MKPGIFKTWKIAITILILWVAIALLGWIVITTIFGTLRWQTTVPIKKKIVKSYEIGVVGWSYVKRSPKGLVIKKTSIKVNNLIGN